MSTSTNSRFAIAGAVSCLAAAIAYFSWTVHSVSQQLPLILSGLDNSGATIEGVVGEVKRVNDQIPDILKRVDAINEQVPDILKQIDSVQTQIPAILKQVEAVEQNIKPILAESAALRAELPSLLKEVELVRKSLPSIIEESQGYRTLAPQILKESADIRASIPPTLTRVEGIVASADQVGKNASEAAVQGFFTGLIKTPFRMAKNAGEAILPGSGLDPDDKQAIIEAMNKLMLHPDAGSSEAWSNPQSGHHGYIVLKEIHGSSKGECRDVEIHPQSIVKGHGNITLCKDKSGIWQLKK
ncbi:hypothetical protein [Agaribacterium sp. ZY112]|uniref:hypothetical protein n=1 Tax=Agaribacterium sp. ZY112 TaxID=3233574 RepID=UPI00352485F8